MYDHSPLNQQNQLYRSIWYGKKRDFVNPPYTLQNTLTSSELEWTDPKSIIYRKSPEMHKNDIETVHSIRAYCKHFESSVAPEMRLNISARCMYYTP